jgi:hypothetical protein
MSSGHCLMAGRRNWWLPIVACLRHTHGCSERAPAAAATLGQIHLHLASFSISISLPSRRRRRRRQTAAPAEWPDAVGIITCGPRKANAAATAWPGGGCSRTTTITMTRHAKVTPSNSIPSSARRAEWTMNDECSRTLNAERQTRKRSRRRLARWGWPGGQTTGRPVCGGCGGALASACLSVGRDGASVL